SACWSAWASRSATSSTASAGSKRWSGHGRRLPVTGDVGVLGSGGCHIFNRCGFPAPALQDFNWKPFFTIGSFGFTKPMLLAIVAALVVIVFFWVAFWKPKLGPRGLQKL